MNEGLIKELIVMTPITLRTGGAPRLELSVLGPLRARCGGRSATPTAPKSRQVLALLLLHANQAVPVSAMFRELWDGEPPRTALRTIQTYIGQLRKLLADALRIDVPTVARE